jgi:hypothetical protein
MRDQTREGRMTQPPEVLPDRTPTQRTADRIAEETT